MDDYQSFLLSCLEESLKLLPKVIYLNDVIYDISITAKVHMDIILSYFFQCHNCKNFFNEEDVRKCQCREWCKYYARMNIYAQKCNKCASKEKLYHETMLKCIIPQCENSANYGSMTQALYCMQHTSSSIIVSYHRFCNVCNKAALYYGNGFKCEEHKNDKSKIFFRQGKYFAQLTSKHLSKLCDICNRVCTVIYSCENCCKNRCGKCAQFDMFVLKFETFRKTYCNGCCGSLEHVDLVYTNYNFFDVQFDCESCEREGHYIDNNYFVYCELHKSNSCEYMKICVHNICKYEYCYAPSIIGDYCRFHKKNS